MTPSLSYSDHPMDGLGVTPWRDALGDSIQLLDMLSQAPGRQVLPTVSHLISATESRRVTLPVNVVEMIGFDAAASVVVVEGSDGANTLRSAYMPRRVRHTHDDHAVWLDEDGASVGLLGQLMLLPSRAALVEDSGTWQTWWACAVPETLGDVIGAFAPDGPLLAGIDFYRTGDRLMFRQHPALLFPDGHMSLMVQERGASPLAYAAGVDGDKTLISVVNQIKRAGATAARLQRLADAYMRVVRMPEAGTIVSKHALPEGCRYVTADFEVIVPYDHVEYEIGRFVPARAAFGDCVTVLDRGQAGQDWWRGFDLFRGISLDPWCPVKGLRMPANPVKVTSYDDDGVIRVNVFVEGPAALVTKFQTWCQQAERRLPATRHLAPALGLVSANQTRYVDGLALLFNQLWGRNAMLVLSPPSTPKQLRGLLQELVPLHSVLVWVDKV